MPAGDRPTKLTNTQAKVLADATRGWVYRSERGYDLGALYDMNLQKKVTATVARLVALGLLEIGHRDGLTIRWKPTDAGRAWLARHNPEET